MRIQAACRTRCAECLSVPRCAYKQLVDQTGTYLRSQPIQRRVRHFAFVKPTPSRLLCVRQANVKQTTLRSSSKRQANYFVFAKPMSSKPLCVRPTNVEQTTLRSSSKRQANCFATIKQTSSNRQVCLLRFNVICIRMYVQRYIST